ncbi:hypothetical protein MYAER_3594 [Microcystis aeruginosa NIES-2549]|uniref:Uncharacterized protein n=1 Tax=Microcystis aeruginosa NIES-2549 TaxID=1641812 RepID=A0A0F6U6L4_MICAE|nr:hypothetical protein MYAER_3594 [Microcystis aeruginosa NIES-2549]AOC54341.1 hypothetical protein amyaer_3638 [Microcystis aeruginosa NIES-2481]
MKSNLICHLPSPHTPHPTPRSPGIRPRETLIAKETARLDTKVSHR